MCRPEQKPQNPPDSAQRRVQRAQNERTEDAEIERRTECDRGIEEQPQPPSANIERQRQQAQQQKQRVQQVRRDGSPISPTKRFTLLTVLAVLLMFRSWFLTS